MAGLTLALLAHQDDEFAIFPLIDRAIRRGDRLQVVYATRHRVDATEMAREQESIAALRALGAGSAELIFLGMRSGVFDGECHLRLDHLLNGIAEFLRAEPRGISAVLVPAWEGGHMDHDCVHAAALILQHRGLLPRAEIRQFPLYTSGRWFAPFRVMKLRPENGPAMIEKFGVIQGWQWLRLLALYRSQRRSFLGLAPEAAIRYLLARRVATQPATLARIMERPHQGALFYEGRYGVAFADVAAAISAQLDRTVAT